VAGEFSGQLRCVRSRGELADVGEDLGAGTGGSVQVVDVEAGDGGLDSRG